MNERIVLALAALCVVTQPAATQVAWAQAYRPSGGPTRDRRPATSRHSRRSSSTICAPAAARDWHWLPKHRRKITEQSLVSSVQNIASVQGALRASHLRYHRATVEVPTPEQITRYNDQRGYGGATTGGHRHGRH